MDKQTFDRFRGLVYEKSGIALSPQKETLVKARISRRMRELGLATEKAYLEVVEKDGTGRESTHLIDAVSTNFTSFFREPEHFDFIAEAFSKWLTQGQLRFRFWSAASSTGEEPYSLAMTLLDNGAAGKSDTRILATDINTQVLGTCKKGVYGKDRLDSVSPSIRQRYFDAAPGDGETKYTVKSDAKRLLTFRQLNLSTPPYPMRGPLDAIFCRNVIIYFDKRVRQALFDEAYRLLKPGGYLFIGHAENLTGLQTNFKVVRPSIFVKPGAWKDTSPKSHAASRIGRRVGSPNRRSENRAPDRRAAERRYDDAVVDGVKRVYIQAGDVEVSREPCIFSTLLGSCVSVCLYDKKHHWGGMNHFMHVGLNPRDPMDTKWGLPAISSLIQKLQLLGSHPRDLEVKVIGGGNVLKSIKKGIGDRNVAEAFSEIERWGLPIVTTDIGGSKHRKLEFHSHTGKAELL